MAEMAVKERPILYSAPMILGLLSGEKTQTRRIVTPQPPGNMHRHCWFNAPVYGWSCEPEPAAEWHRVNCPFGLPGDHLWVREAHALSVRDPAGPQPEDDPSNWDVVYRTDGDSGQWRDHRFTPGGKLTAIPIKGPWRPSIFMYRWASRITLEISEVRVQKIQDISDEDIKAEGIVEYIRSKGLDPARTNLRAAWIDLWDSINAKRDGGMYSWGRNPWCWSISFKRVEQS